jgi:hypothetical protein
LKAFDYWRILNGFLKFDPQMPRILNNHFREIEIKIVSEIAWQSGSPVVEIIKQQIVQVSPDSLVEEQKTEQIMQPFNMFFKRVLHLTA